MLCDASSIKKKRRHQIFSCIGVQADDMTIRSTRALYLVKPFGGREVLYIGKADRQCLRDRWNCRSKNRWSKFERKEKKRLAPLVTGFFTTRPVTKNLIEDVERLLIFLVQPRLNRSGKQSCRLHHRSLVVRCGGLWPHSRTTFTYHNELPLLLRISSE